MEKDVPAAAALGVAGEFEIAERQITMAADGHVANDRCESLPVFLHDICIGVADVGEGAGVGDFQDQRVIQGAGTLEDGAATGAATEDRDGVLPGLVEISFGAGFVGVAEDEEVFGRLPEAENLFAGIQQRFVAGEVLLGRGQCEIEKLHGRKVANCVLRGKYDN